MPDTKRSALRLLAPGLLAALALGPAACGGEDKPTGEAAATDEVTIQDFEFLPAEVTVPAGTELTFVNDDTAAHTATSGTSPSSDGMFDTGVVAEGDDTSVALDEPGSVAYFRKLHPNMKGTITVE